MKQECYEIGKHLVLLHMLLGVSLFDVNDMKMFTEIENTRNSAGCANEKKESGFFLS